MSYYTQVICFFPFSIKEDMAFLLLFRRGTPRGWASFLLVRYVYLIFDRYFGAYYIWPMQYVYPLKNDYRIQLLRELMNRLSSEFEVGI
jgi:hypothetical protein